MYRKILLFTIAAVAAVSCLDKSSSTVAGPLLAHMESMGQYNYATLFGEDSLYFDNVGAKLGIQWDCVCFYHSISDDGNFQGGFLMSYLHKPKTGTDELPNNKYRVNCAASEKAVNTYLVFEQNPDDTKMPAQDFSFGYASIGTCTMTSCLVNNTVAFAQAADELLEEGDKVVLRAIGLKEKVETGRAEITLAERTSAVDSVMYNWTKFDLSNLKAVDMINFELVIPEGKAIPATVCMDDLMAQISLSY